MDEAKLARTESAFREVNEAIAQTAARFDAEETDFVCECADPDCALRVTADLDEYDLIREDGRHFIVAPGHDEPEIERVIARRGDYDVVEKVGEKVAAIVQALNPRAHPA
ncbi:MAG TPA: hypothetical protein VFA05_06425 [Gaiellaceae bacterium]|nr:hypothetical protein [Gaiellaceae bacterium]